MVKPITSRRDFLKSSGSAVGASWLTLNAPLILAAGQTAQAMSDEQAGYANISAEEALELGAMVDQIIPPDETPGATDTGVVYFIDAALGSFMSANAPLLRQGLNNLAAKVKSPGNPDSKFSDLAFDRQTDVLKEIEDTAFFKKVLSLTMMGMFCLPEYSGNRDEIGWDLLGFDHRHVWQAPFGYYDADAHAQNIEKGAEHGNS